MKINKLEQRNWENYRAMRTSLCINQTNVISNRKMLGHTVRKHPDTDKYLSDDTFIIKCNVEHAFGQIARLMHFT